MRLPPNPQLIARFAWPGETWVDVVARVAALRPLDHLLRAGLESGVLVPGGQVLRGVGDSRAVLFNSCVLAVRLEETIQALAARITAWTKLGVGIGVNLMPLLSDRHGSLLEAITVIGQSQEGLWKSGVRRTATMVVIEPHVAGLEEAAFALMDRYELRHLNMAVLLSDPQMRDFEAQRGSAPKQIGTLLQAALATGNPGFVFIDRVNRDSPNDAISACNACAEAHLRADEALPLASINLAELVGAGGLDEAKLTEVVGAGVRLLDATIDASAFPSPECRIEMVTGRRLGLGILGLDSAFQKLGLAYDSPGALTLSGYWASCMRRAAEDEAAKLDAARSTRLLKRRGLLSIAPTGGISALWGVSSGIEPTFGAVLDTEFSRIRVQNAGLLGKAPHEIAWSWHVDHLAAWQAAVDGGVSKTVNLPVETECADAERLLLHAWRAGTKAISLFRQGSRAPAMRAA